MKKRILVVDDEAHIREVIEYALSREGFLVVLADNGQRGFLAATSNRFDAIVLDVMLPDKDGLTFCRELRSEKSPISKTPVLFLSARADEVDRIVGLELGGDDYLTKPFSPRELVARVRALVRRSEQAGESDVGHHQLEDASGSAVPPQGPGGFTLDGERREVVCQGEQVELTSSEFELLATLFARPGIVFARGQLRRDGEDDSERAVDTHVKRVRAKFRQFGLDPITTVHGVGYKATVVERKK